ncbi:hypothetical protein AAG570_010405 [Ranatra chinensis]|uniref:EF-hand domain-containing protein n=1 Tax=Ranatra chinensis TaxID=642074 RepID=A0ABD0YMH4_9HEMI
MFFAWISNIIGFFKGIMKSPIQKTPQCFVPQENYDQDGEIINRYLLRRELLGYERMAIDFDKNLLRTREDSYLQTQFEKLTKLRRVEDRYPKWDESVLSYLSNVFAIFDREGVGLIHREDFNSILLNLGDESPSEVRLGLFDRMDTDHDGWINFEEFYDCPPAVQHDLNTAADYDDWPVGEAGSDQRTQVGDDGP